MQKRKVHSKWGGNVMVTTLTIAIISIPTQLWIEYISATSFKFLYRHTAYMCAKKGKERKRKEKVWIMTKEKTTAVCVCIKHILSTCSCLCRYDHLSSQPINKERESLKNYTIHNTYLEADREAHHCHCMPEYMYEFIDVLGDGPCSKSQQCYHCMHV